MHSRIDMAAAPMIRILWSVLAVAELALLGCAGLGGVRGDASADREIRPFAPAEYDVLVAQLARKQGRMSEAAAAYERAVAKDDESAYLHRKTAEALALVHRLKDAVAHAERAHELDSEDRSLRLFLAQLYRLTRDPAGAERMLRDPAGDPLDATAASMLFRMYLASRRLPDALEAAEWWVQHKPESLKARRALARAYQVTGRGVDAERLLREVMERDPGNLNVYDALARMLRARGDFSGEIALYGDVLERYPDHHVTLIRLAEAHLAANDLDAAIVVFEGIEDLYPRDLRSVARLGFLKYERREFAEAAGRFERVLESSPERHELAFFLGIIRRRISDDSGAIEAFDRIPIDHEHYVEARTQVASILEQQGDFEGALAEVEAVISVKTARALELYRASLLAEVGDFDGAVLQLEGMLNGTAEDDEVLYSLGVIHSEADRVDEAISLMQRALERNPDNAGALNFVGYTWAESGTNLDEAEGMILRAIELRPDDGYIADSLGWVYYMRARPLVESGRGSEAQGYIDRALKELKRAEKLTGGDPVVSEHLGDTYLLLNQKSLALERFEEAVRLEPRLGEQPNLLEKVEGLRRELQ